MSRPLWLALLVCALTVGAAPGTSGPGASDPETSDPETSDPGADRERRVDSLVGSFAAAGAFQGVVLMAVDGEIVYERAFGKASFELDVANTPTTRFQIASVSKPFTAAAILLLAEGGRIDLHAPLDRVIPGYPNGDRLTIHHLLTHTSGIPNLNALPEYEDWSKDSHDPEQLVSLFRDRPLAFAPGERYDYSNSNYNLLAWIIETVSKQPYGRFLEESIFRPLGMRDTGHRGDPAAIVPRLAPGYMPRGARGYSAVPYLDWSIKTGNGSLYSTARDLLRFHNALQRGELLGPASLAAAYDFDSELGYGWFSGQRFGERRVTINGRSPGYTAHFERYVDRDRCFILLSNLYVSPPQPLLEGLAAILLDREEYEPEGFDLQFAPDDAELAGLAGRYEFGDDWFVGAVEAEVESRGDHLAVVYLEGSREGYEFPLVPVGERTFYDRKHGGIVRFERGGELAGWTLVYVYGREWRATPRPPDPPAGG